MFEHDVCPVDLPMLRVDRGDDRSWKRLDVIGIDEVSRPKGQRYVRRVYDLQRRRLVVGEHRDGRHAGRTGVEPVRSDRDGG